jgi:hypothetical protein
VDRKGRPVGLPPQLGVDWTEDPDFSIIHLRSGRGPRTASEVAVDAATAKSAGYRVGDRVTVALRGGSRTFTLTRPRLRRMVRYEAVIISVFGGLLGLGLGTVFGIAIQHAMAGQGMRVLAIPYDRLGLYLIAAVLIGVVAAIWPARRAARMDILRAIISE